MKSDIWGAQNAGLGAACLSTKIGRDNLAKSDPTSLVSFSRRLGNLREKDIVPDLTVTTLGEI